MSEKHVSLQIMAVFMVSWLEMLLFMRIKIIRHYKGYSLNGSKYSKAITYVKLL